jgi:acetoin utilization protein AcuB
MFVSKSMTSKIVTVHPETTLLEARQLLKKHGIRHLPVVDGNGKLVGIITDRDIRSALPAEFFSQEEKPVDFMPYEQLTVDKAMTRNPATISPENTIEDALLLIQKMRVGAFPVVDREHRAIGILSVRDLLRAFINVLGIEEPGTLLCLKVEDKLGQMKKIVDAITEENISFGSILVARHWEPNVRAVFPYLLTNNVSRVKKKLAALGFEPMDPMQWALDRRPRQE